MEKKRFYIAKMTENTYLIRDGVFTTDLYAALMNSLNELQALHARDAYGCRIFEIKFDLLFDYELDNLRKELGMEEEEKEEETNE